MFKKKPKSKVFGVPLVESVLCNRPQNQNVVVADLVSDVIRYLEKHEFFLMEGIYRVPGRQSRLEALRESYDKGKPIEFEAKMEDPFTCADLLLLYLRSLPEALIPQPMAGDLENTGPDDVGALRKIVFELPAYNRVLLMLIVRHAAKVAAAEQSNKMGAKNVTIVFVPSLYCSPKLFSILLCNAEQLFARICSCCGEELRGEGEPCHMCEMNSGAEDQKPTRKSLGPQKNKAIFARGSRSSSASSTPPPPTTSPRRPLPLPSSSPRSNSPRGSPRASGSPRSQGSPRKPLGAVFGQPLKDCCRMQKEAVVLPSIVRQCWKYLESFKTQAGGVYVKAPSNMALVESLMAKFDTGARVTLADELKDNEEGPLVAAMLFKRYLSSLPTPLFGELTSLFEKSVGSPIGLSSLVFRLSLEVRTFLLHFISHIRTIVKYEVVSADTLIQKLSVGCRCTPDVLTAIYNNRRTIMQPSCGNCEKLIQLAESPKYEDGRIFCDKCKN